MNLGIAAALLVIAGVAVMPWRWQLGAVLLVAGLILAPLAVTTHDTGLEPIRPTPTAPRVVP